MDLDTLYRASVEGWSSKVSTITDEHWDLPTPCTDWTVRDLVNHVAGEDLWTPPLVAGQTIEQVGDQFDGDVLGDDPVTAVRAAARAADAAALDHLLPGARVHLSYGEEDAGEYALQLSADHLVHGWDLAAATGQERGMDPDLVAAVAAWFADREEMYRSGGAIGPRVSATGDAQEALLAAFGRSAHWEPAQASSGGVGP